jgi:two-component system CheB/CheR fusion protein
MAMVQEPKSTEYDGMPSSAIATGMVDYVLPAAEMPAQLIAFVAHAFGKTAQLAPPPAPRAEDVLKKIFLLVRAQTGHDFSQYKRNTVLRRVERRMAVHQIKGLDEYIRYLQKAPAEVDALFRDMLIGVTSFFRDPEAFRVLHDQAIPQLFAGKPKGGLIRVWVPGCSTGEEAYSIAILLQERLDALKQSFKLQVFATDIDPRAIERARAGVYPASIATDISPERLTRFFSQEADCGDYRIQKAIRDMVIFSEQDLIRDPPFSKLGLISCRNVLIYVEGELQQKLIPLFHYALNPGGMLFLGTSETVGEFVDLFATIDRKAKLYERKEEAAGARRLVHLPRLSKDAFLPRPSGKAPVETKLGPRELTEQTLLQHYAPPGALVNEHGDILYLHGRTGKYLEPAPGEADLNILKMAREGLRQALTATLRKAVALKAPVRHEGLRVKTDGDFAIVNLTAQPVTAGLDLAVAPKLFLVGFEDVPAAATQGSEEATLNAGEGGGKGAANGDGRIATLRQELRAKEKYLRTTNEELETSNEELKSSNEELQSVNEELQSTNEELETSKEELQSVNEELATVNVELQNKVDELSRSNNDMNNLLAGTGIGIIFVDHQLKITRYTPAITQIINLIWTDVGRPVGHIVSNLVGYDTLVADVRAVLETLTTKEVEVQNQTGAWFLLRIRPYRTLENVIEGAVISFADITEVKKAQAALRESEAMRRLSVVVRDSHDAVAVQDLDGRILAWNSGAERMYGWSETEALTMNILDLIPEDRRQDALAVVRRLGQAEVLEPYRTQRVAKGGRIVEIWLTATALVNDAGDVYAIATTEREIQ